MTASSEEFVHALKDLRELIFSPPEEETSCDKPPFNPKVLVRTIAACRKSFLRYRLLEEHIPVRDLLKSWGHDVSSMPKYASTLKKIHSEMVGHAARSKGFLSYFRVHYAKSMFVCMK
jgi:hypothetical protein